MKIAALESGDVISNKVAEESSNIFHEFTELFRKLVRSSYFIA